MPSLVKIRVERARDLPVMDRASNTDSNTDSYVEIKLGEYQHKTATCRKSLNPYYGEEIRFEIVDDSVLQNSPLEFKVSLLPDLNSNCKLTVISILGHGSRFVFL